MAKKVIQTDKPLSNKVMSTKDFGAFIKYKRTSNGLSIEQAAQLCNINHLTLSKLEKGSQGVRMSTALEVAMMFGLNVLVEE